MKILAQALGAAAALLAFASTSVHAGGPLAVCNGQPLKYPGAGTVNLNYDGGGALGSRTKTQADAIVTSAISLWTNVTTSSIVVGRGADLPVDVTSANFSTYLGGGTYTDGLNPVVYDTDGMIIDTLLGAGERNHVLGFAGSAWYGAPTCSYAEGRAVINGYLSVSTATMTNVIAHEIGHLIGLDHAQLDSSQGLASSNYPLMYPVAYRTANSLHEDDVAAVSALYPHSSFSTNYGHVSGNFTVANGATAVRGANLWAREINTSRLYSVVSDYLLQNTGYFRLALPAGTYTLHAEAIDRSFNGGSSVGPYSAEETDPSFQAPLYSGTTPMAPVTLGNGSPVQFSINAGCVATAIFNLNGTGSIGGNCVSPVAASMTSPAGGSVLAGSSQLFQWNSAPGATLYQVFVGTSVGAFNLGYFPTAGTTSTSTTVTGLPTDGRTIYVRLHTAIGGVWYYRDYTYTAASAAVPTPAGITSPANGAVLGGATQIFQWNSAPGASLYQVFVGSSVGAYDIGYFPATGTTGTSTTITGLPTDGRTLYVRLHSAIGGVWYSRDYTYTAASVAPLDPAVITSPVNGSTLAGSSQLFQWNSAPGATLYQVFVGNSVGAFDIGYYPATGTTGLSTTITGLPTDGRTLYVRLYSLLNGAYQFRDFTYRAASGAATPALMTSPANGSTLTGSSQLFQWNNAGAALYQVFVGTSVGASDIGYYPAAGTTGTSTTVTGLPTDGRTLYVRLYSAIGDTWHYRDFTYTAAAGAAASPASMANPVNGSRLGSSTVTFQWNNAGAALYQVFVGSTVGAFDYGYFPAAGTTSTSTTVTGLPVDGRTLYVRLHSAIGGTWYFRDYTYVAGP